VSGHGRVPVRGLPVSYSADLAVRMAGGEEDVDAFLRYGDELRIRFFVRSWMALIWSGALAAPLVGDRNVDLVVTFVFQGVEGFFKVV